MQFNQMTRPQWFGVHFVKYDMWLDKISNCFFFILFYFTLDIWNDVIFYLLHFFICQLLMVL
jgi:hypothetical protein